MSVSIFELRASPLSGISASGHLHFRASPLIMDLTAMTSRIHYLLSTAHPSSRLQSQTLLRTTAPHRMPAPRRILTSMSKRSLSSQSLIAPPKRQRTVDRIASPCPIAGDIRYNGADWPAPHNALRAARNFLLETVSKGYRVVIAPDKDADGLTGELTVGYR